MGPLDQLSREVEELRRDMALMRKVLVRQGVVQSVNTVAGTVVVQFPGVDAAGQPATSLPVPWFQRGTEHRPPAVGDHALVIDPSLGNGAGVALIGWPSTVRPPPAAGAKTLLYSGSDAVGIDSPTIALGTLLPAPPNDYAALASRVDAEFLRIWDLLTTPTTPPPAVVSGLDAGEPGLIALLSAASLAAELVESVAASEVKVK